MHPALCPNMTCRDVCLQAADAPRDGAEEKLVSTGKEDSEQGWGSSWDKAEATPQAARPQRTAEGNPTFSPRGEIDDFLSCRSPNDPKTTSSHSRSSRYMSFAPTALPALHKFYVSKVYRCLSSAAGHVLVLGPSSCSLILPLFMSRLHVFPIGN